jgi:hypothetical protein
MREIKFRIYNKTENMMSYTKYHFIGKTLGFNIEPEVQNGIYELMQYTGLKDKNSKEIYEGDIVVWYEYGRKQINEIIWEAPQFYPLSMMVDCCNGFNEKSGFEVIGNIYENPELLEKTL